MEKYIEPAVKTLQVRESFQRATAAINALPDGKQRQHADYINYLTRVGNVLAAAPEMSQAQAEFVMLYAYKDAGERAGARMPKPKTATGLIENFRLIFNTSAAATIALSETQLADPQSTVLNQGNIKRQKLLARFAPGLTVARSLRQKRKMALKALSKKP